MAPLMRGVTWLRQYIASHLEDTLPPIIELAREQWELEEWELPTPATYNSYDPLTAYAYPNIGSFVRATNNWRRRDLVAGEEHYSANYSVLLFIWVCTPDKEDGSMRPEDDRGNAMRLRDDELACLRNAILSTPSLGSNGVLEVREETLAEDYLEPIQLSKESGLYLAGGTLSFDVKVSENNLHELISEAVEEITVQVEKIME